MAKYIILNVIKYTLGLPWLLLITLIITILIPFYISVNSFDSAMSVLKEIWLPMEE